MNIDLYLLDEEIKIWEAGALLLNIDPKELIAPTGWNDDHSYIYGEFGDSGFIDNPTNERYRKLIDTITKKARDGCFSIVGVKEEYINEHSSIDSELLKKWALSTGLFKCEYLGNNKEVDDSIIDKDLNEANSYPMDLAIAIEAWTAVNNGYGRKGDTFKNRTIYWLEENHDIGRKNRELSTETNNLDARASRIATIINPNSKAKPN